MAIYSVTFVVAVFICCVVLFLQSETVQRRVYKSLKLWSMYADLEESLGTFQVTMAAMLSPKAQKTQTNKYSQDYRGLKQF